MSLTMPSSLTFILFSFLWILKVLANNAQRECCCSPSDNWCVKGDMRCTVYHVLWEKPANTYPCEAGNMCPSEPNDLNFSIFSLSMPLNSDQCRQYFLGLVTANMASHWRWGGTVWKVIKPLTCEVRKAIWTIPHGMPYAQLCDYDTVEWLCPCSSAR